MKQSDFFSGKQQAKYLNVNPLAKYLVNNFFNGVEHLLMKVGMAENVLEIGCGEGHVTEIIARVFKSSNITVTDIAEKMIEVTRQRLGAREGVNYRIENAANLSFQADFFDCIVACEVLEHLDDPCLALEGFKARLKPGGYLLASVPREPIWRILNMVRLKYLSRFGNTFGHVNHWSARKFKRLAGKELEIVDCSLPLPWTIILARKR